jgi:hypothetical protein
MAMGMAKGKASNTSNRNGGTLWWPLRLRARLPAWRPGSTHPAPTTVARHWLLPPRVTLARNDCPFGLTSKAFLEVSS